MRTLLPSLVLLLLTTTVLPAQTVQWYEPGKARPATTATPKSAEYQAAYHQTQVGQATYYADYLAGQPTAYGETYQPLQMTAAHKVLPLGTILRVTRLDNGQTVDVRVNDSGSLCQGCVVSLSRAAADQIGLTTVGKTRVSVQRIGFSNWNPQPQRLTNQASARGATPATYQQPRTPVTAPSAYQPAYARTPRSGTILPNRIGNSQPDFGDAYGRTSVEREDVNAYQPAGTVDANALRPATSGPTPIAPATRSNTIEPYRPAVIEREVTGTAAPRSYQTPYPAYRPAPAQYQGARSAAELSPVGEVQVATNPVQAGYAVQLAAYGNAANAMRQVRSLQAQGVENIYLASVDRPDGSTLNRVLVGPFTEMAQAQGAADALKQTQRLTGIVVKLR